ncbi:MAG: hypothetical protein JWO33_221, partial [Caulobacteraceae bacterium]|nr:hypothetical protein [Caulobacteraceae bacterium]
GQAGLVMIPRFPEWRYGIQEHMVWYRSLRLLRQPESGQWNPVVARVMEALDALP